MTYQERLRVPASWWLIGLGMAVGIALATAIYAPLWVNITAVAVATLVVLITLSQYSLTITITPDHLQVAKHVLEMEYIADAKVVDKSTGSEDRESYLLTRPYATGLAKVDLQDPADPHSAWLISTNNPSEMVAAIKTAKGQL